MLPSSRRPQKGPSRTPDWVLQTRASELVLFTAVSEREDEPQHQEEEGKKARHGNGGKEQLWTPFTSPGPVRESIDPSLRT